MTTRREMPGSGLVRVITPRTAKSMIVARPRGPEFAALIAARKVPGPALRRLVTTTSRTGWRASAGAVTAAGALAVPAVAGVAAGLAAWCGAVAVVGTALTGTAAMARLTATANMWPASMAERPDARDAADVAGPRHGRTPRPSRRRMPHPGRLEVCAGQRRAASTDEAL